MSARPDADGPPLATPSAAKAAVARNRQWYHSIEVAPGVVTPGRIDLRRTAASLLPSDLSGARALDVGTFDGFWAFELERRGAEVVAIDTGTTEENDWPPLNRPRLADESRALGVQLGLGFRIAGDLLRSRARRVVCDVYELTPEAIGGRVDFAFSGAILLHLRDPVRALERIREALHPGGRLLTLEPFSLRDTGLAPRRPVARFQAASRGVNWWYPNLAALSAWHRAGGFVAVRRRGFHRPNALAGMRRWYCGHECTRER